MKVVLSAVLEFDSREELIDACMECIKCVGLEYGEDNSVPEYWEDEGTWTDEVIYDFIKCQGSAFYEIQNGDYEDLFNGDVYETRVTIE